MSYKRKKRVNGSRYKTLSGFLHATVAPNHNISTLNQFFVELTTMPVGRTAFATVSIVDQAKLGHCIPLFFTRKAANIHCELVDIRGSEWPRQHGYYSPRRFIQAVDRLFKALNENFVFTGKDSLRCPVHVSPLPKYPWCRFLVPGESYLSLSNPLRIHYQNMRPENCREAALSYLWFRCCATSRQSALATFRKVMTIA